MNEPRLILVNTSTEYFCKDCGSSNIIHGELNELDKEALKKLYYNSKEGGDA